MTRAKDTLQAIGLVALIGIAGAIGNNAGDYAAPTKAEIDVQQQVAHLCAADGWPDDAKIAYERACKGELKRKST